MALIALDGLLGASLIGVLVSAVVFGITCLQIYLYFTEHSQNDSTLLKAFVLILFFLDTLHLALLSHSIYFYTVSCFGDYFALTVATWSLLVQIPISSIVTLSVQLFFAYRIHKLSDGHNWWMPLAICVLAAGEMAAGIGMTTVGFIIRKFAFEDRIVSWAASGLTAGFVCDTMITTGMVHYLNRNQSQFPRTQKAVSMLTNYALNTGLITTILALITLIVLLTHHEELIYAPFYFMLARVYACSFMSALNTRSSIRAVMDDLAGPVMLSHMRTPSFADVASIRVKHGREGSDIRSLPIRGRLNDGWTQGSLDRPRIK